MCASRHNSVHFVDIESPSDVQKWLRTPACFVTFYFEMCASRHNGVHFLTRASTSATSKSGPRPQVFCHFLLRNVLRATTACTFSTSQRPKVVRDPGVLPHFYFEMCFAPQRRALFPHLNFQKSSEHGVFCHF